MVFFLERDRRLLVVTPIVTRILFASPEDHRVIRNSEPRTPYSELRTPHSELPHFELRTPHSAFRTPYSELRTPYSELRIPNSPLRTPHSELRTPHSEPRTPNSAPSLPLFPLPVRSQAGMKLRLKRREGKMKTDNTNRSWAILFARLVLGLIFFMAGVWKVFQLRPLEHARKYFLPFADTFLPVWSLWAVGVVIPFVELIAGGLVIIGLRTRDALILLGFVLAVVTFGHLLKEPLYQFHTHVIPRLALLLFVLMLPHEDDRFSIDRLISRRKQLNPKTADAHARIN